MLLYCNPLPTCLLFVSLQFLFLDFNLSPLFDLRSYFLIMPFKFFII